MQVAAKLKYARISPQKCRIVADMVRGQPVGTALNTLRYVDCALLARRITATTLVSVGLMDDICPPSTVFAAYNEINADKDIIVYPYSGHSVPHAHAEPQLKHLRRHLPV